MTLLRQHAPSARLLAFVWPKGRSASDVFQTVDTPGKPGHQPGEGHGLTTHEVLTRRAGRAETCLSGSTEARRTNPAFSGFSLCLGEVSGRVIPTFDPIVLDVDVIGLGKTRTKRGRTLSTRYATSAVERDSRVIPIRFCRHRTRATWTDLALLWSARPSCRKAGGPACGQENPVPGIRAKCCVQHRLV